MLNAFCFFLCALIIPSPPTPGHSPALPLFRLRHLPHQSADVIGDIDRGMVVKSLEEQGDWIRIVFHDEKVAPTPTPTLTGHERWEVRGQSRERLRNWALGKRGAV